MAEKEWKRTTLLETLSSVPADKLSVGAAVLMYLDAALLVKLSTMYYTLSSQDLTLLMFVATGLIVEISWLLKS